MSDVGKFKASLTGLAVGYDTDTTPTVAEGGPVDQLTDIAVSKDLPLDGAAATAIGQTILFNNSFNFPLRLVRATIVTSAAAVVAHADNHATITLQVDDGLNGAPATAATATTDLDDPNPFGTTADVAEDMGLTAANCLIPPGGNLMLVQTKGGTGVVLPLRCISFRLRRT